jgi:bifunctional aspartokinase / homoserine dehydrogenase 1
LPFDLLRRFIFLKMRVLKFGGTSVGSVENIKKMLAVVADAQKKHGRVIVVFSAMSGVTNKLLEAADLASQSNENYKSIIKDIETKHYDVINALIEAKNQSKAMGSVKLFINELEEILQGVFLLRELSDRTKDLVVSFGERLSTYIISEVVRQEQADVNFVDARNLIKTDNSFTNAKVSIKTTEENIKEYFAKNTSLQLVTGFIASNSKNETTTLGRGGSDYTAAIIGGALENCEEIEIWTDVDGMLTADPRVVKKAFSLPNISYIEAMELSHFGAKVIYPPTLQPAFAKNIPISIKNTFNPTHPGTLITNVSAASNYTIKGITSISDVALVSIQGSGMMGETGFSGRMFTALAKHKINIILITQASSEYSITFAVTPTDARRAKAILQDEFENDFKSGKLDPVKIDNEVSIIAIIGENMKQTPGISAKLFKALGTNGINVIAIAQGSSEYNLSVVIGKNDLSKALNALHEGFFSSDLHTLNVFVVGLGLIGNTLLKQIAAQKEYLAAKKSMDINIVGIANSKKMLLKADGIDIDNWSNELETKGEVSNLDTFFEGMRKLNLPNSIFIDNTSNKDIVKYYEPTLNASISVVTPNKVANSGPYEYYLKLNTTAAKRNVQFLYETNVGAGLPIIGTLKDLLNSGDQIIRIEAVLSGTLSFIFNSYKAGTSFHDIVKDAKAKGYTEPDPRDDLNGMDVARKILILARDSGFALEPSDVEVENILPQNCCDAKTVDEFFVELNKSNDHFEKRRAAAEAEGKVLRFIATLENGKASVSLKAVDGSHPFYSMQGSDNIISFTTERYKDRPLVVKGPGAGAEVTAAGVFADIIKVGSILK